MIIKDARSGHVYDVDYDGKRMMIVTVGGCPVFECPCCHSIEIPVSFDRADLLELLGATPK